jgi:acetoin utilization deacetylase AcuC-like enzyme
MNAALEGVQRAGAKVQTLDADAATALPWIVRVHAPEYRGEFEEAVERRMPLFQSGDNPISPGSYEAAIGAVSATIEAAERIWLRDELDRAFIIARPPGHHAERAAAMGFCFFNTIACAAERLRAIEGIDRVFIFDWDVHHGNGTQHLFEDRDDVFYASTHRFPFYPGTGAAHEIGVGRGRGTTLNVPFRGGTGDADYLRAMEEQIVKAIDDFRPDAILLSAGFDAHRRDPLGGMRVNEQTFGEMTRRIVEAASRHGRGKVLSLLEGGYDREGLAASVAEHVGALSF